MEVLYAKAKALRGKSEQKFKEFMSERANSEVERLFSKAIQTDTELASRIAAYHADCFPLIEEAKRHGERARGAYESAIRYSAQRHVQGEEQPDWQGLRKLRAIAGEGAAEEAIKSELSTFLGKVAANKRRVVVPADFGQLIGAEHRAYASIRKEAKRDH